MLSALKKALHGLCRRRFNARHKALDLDAYLILTPFSALGWLRHLEATPALLSLTSLHHDNCIFSSLPVEDFSCSSCNGYNVWEDTGTTSLR